MNIANDIFDGYGIEIILKNPVDFLKVKETLTRIGVESRVHRTLYQSCHILHKRGRYRIMHFKEMFALDGKESTIVENDIGRRNTITGLLEQWQLIEIDDKDSFDSMVVAPMAQIKIIPFREKDNWTLQPKYNIGNKKTGVR